MKRKLITATVTAVALSLPTAIANAAPDPTTGVELNVSQSQFVYGKATVNPGLGRTEGLQALGPSSSNSSPAANNEAPRRMNWRGASPFYRAFCGYGVHPSGVPASGVRDLSHRVHDHHITLRLPGSIGGHAS